MNYINSVIIPSLIPFSGFGYKIFYLMASFFSGLYKVYKLKEKCKAYSANNAFYNLEWLLKGYFFFLFFSLSSIYCL